MSNQLPSNVASKRVISTSRFVAGVFVHCLVPAYLVAIVLAYLVAPSPTSTGIAERILSWSGLFLTGYAGLTIVAVAAAAAIDPFASRYSARRIERDPRAADIASRRRLAIAVTDGRRLLDEKSRAMLEAIRVLQWNHADPRYQALSTELAEVVRTSGAAIASAAAPQRAGLQAIAAESIGYLHSALASLGEEQARLDEGDARVIARYVRLRHAQPDFSSDRS